MCFFSKQKTAYELRISDWSSDVCSSDLPVAARGARAPPPAAGRALRRGGRRDHRRRAVPPRRGAAPEGAGPQACRGGQRARGRGAGEIGRATGRARVWRYGVVRGGAVSLKKKVIEVDVSYKKIPN